MSIAPPSDIILDVAQAADPQRLQVATAKLAEKAAAAGGATFDTALAGLTPPVTRTALAPLSTSMHSRIAPAHASTAQRFEAMVLQNFIENILPKDSDLFGDAASADMGRSLMAEQIASQVAKSGRIGIAKSIERSMHGHDAPAVAPVSVPAAEPAGSA